MTAEAPNLAYTFWIKYSFILYKLENLYNKNCLDTRQYSAKHLCSIFRAA